MFENLDFCSLPVAEPAVRVAAEEASGAESDAADAFALVPDQVPIRQQPDPVLFAGQDEVCQAVEVLLRGDVDEVGLDLETTALTPWSVGNAPGAATKIGDHTVRWLQKDGVTFDTTPRARVLSLYVPAAGYKPAFDLDRLSADDKANLADALTGKVWVGHNLGFDLQWMLTLSPHCRPERIVDTMLLTTACRPGAEMEMQGEVARVFGGGRTSERKHLSLLHQYLQERAAACGREDKDDGAMPLKALSLWLLDEPMDKTYQKPHNWMPDRLTPGHHAYCMGDAEAPGIIARRLLNLPDNASLQALLDAIDAHEGGRAYRTFEAALHPLVQMQRKGIPWSSEAAAVLDKTLADEAGAAAADLRKVAPELDQPILVPQKPTKKSPNPDPKKIIPMDDLLNPTKGLSVQIKEAIAAAIFKETGKTVPLSDTGGPSLDAKALAFEFPGSRVVAALNVLQGKAKARSMIAKYAAAASIDGRLHPLTSIGTVTGRTSSQEPALQQVPRDPRFRAIFAAPAGHKIVATDFSSIELRIAAALGVRAWRELQAIVAWASGDRSPASRKAAPLYGNLAWLFKNEGGLLPFLKATDLDTSIPDSLQDVTPPRRGASVEEHGRFIAANLARWVYKIRQASGGEEARLPFRAAYTGGLDPHLLTALKMRAQAGDFDLQGKSPLDYLRGLSGDEAKALKGRMKTPRQSAKAVNFGCLYGQQPLGLHKYGVTGYGLDWTVDDAAAAHAGWFDLYPEIGLWHWLLRYAHKVKADIFDPYRSTELLFSGSGGKVYQWYTLSGRPTLSPKITSAASYQDQGTGAEIALRALTALPPNVQDMVVNFVHDEFVLEVPDDRVEEVTETLEKTMIEAADSLLLKFGIPTEVESAVGDCWIH